MLTVTLIGTCVLAWLVFEEGTPGVLYLAGSMLFLWLFGPAVEHAAGAPRFILFCLLGGGVALLAQVALEPDAAAVSIGASGALAAIIGGYALLNPRARMTVLVLVPFRATITQIPALVMLALWLALQLAFAASDGAHAVRGADVVLASEAAAFGFGVAAIRLFTTGWRWPAPSY